jgi:uncharacterized LabA/DUF88 family protein
MRRVLAVDGHSMFYVQQKLGWFFDPRRLLELAAAGRASAGGALGWGAAPGEGRGIGPETGHEIASAFWYTGLKDGADQRPFRDALTSLGFTVRAKLLRELGSDPDQRQFARANLDVEIAVDLLTVAHRCEEVWLLSGSRDLERLVEVLRARGLRIVLMSTDGMVPRELRNAADRFVDLAGLRPQLEKAEAQQQPVFSRT